MVTKKLLANADRCYDDGVFNRDVIDLAMTMPGLPQVPASDRIDVDADGRIVGLS